MARADDGLVAGPLALLDQPGADPPDQRVEPEQRLHQHVDRRGEVVAAAEVAGFVRHQGVDVGRGQVIQQGDRNQQHGPPEADEARLPHPRRGQHGHRRGQRQGSRPAPGRLDPTPARQPEGHDRNAAQRPGARQEQGRIEAGRGVGHGRGDLGRGRGGDGLRKRLGGLLDEDRVRRRLHGRMDGRGQQPAQRRHGCERNQELHRGGQPEAVAHRGAGLPEGHHQHAHAQRHEGRLPQVIEHRGDHDRSSFSLSS